MDLLEWKNSIQTIRKSHKRYAHFDYRTDISKTWEYISNPSNIEHHSFYPFIHYKKDMSKYNKSKVIKTKERDICYASHRDGCIYKYYCFLLDELYKCRVRKDGTNYASVAYRTDLGLSNVELSKIAFDFIRAHINCYVMIVDFTKFFDMLDHKYLKDRWNDLLGTKMLPNDHYAVYKNITKYSTWELKDLLKLNGLPDTPVGKRQLNRKARVLSAEQYKKYRSHIQKNLNPYGIPQGSAISALLANVYMLDVDKQITRYVSQFEGMYMRYSDDFIVVIPNADKEKSNEAFSWIRNVINSVPGLTLQTEKTQFFSYDGTVLCNCGKLFSDTADCGHRFINFLGFTFDGSKISIRSKTVSKYYYRMRRKAKTIRKLNSGDGKDGHVSCQNLYRLYSERGSYGEKGNFLSYVRRAQRSYGGNELITRDTKRHMQKIRKALKDKKSFNTNLSPS